MKYIKTPTGEVYKKEECIEFDDDIDPNLPINYTQALANRPRKPA